MAFTQAFGQAALGTGEMAGLFIPAPGSMADAQQSQINNDPISPLDRLVATISRSPIEWKDGMSAAGPRLAPSDAFLWAASGYQSQAPQQAPAITNHFQLATNQGPAQSQIDPAALSEKINAITQALDSAPPPEINAHQAVTAGTDINKIDQQTTIHAEKAADGHAAIQDIQSTVAGAQGSAPSASGAFGIAAGSAAAGPALGAVSAAIGGPAVGAAVQIGVAAIDIARIGAGSFGVQNTNSYAGSQPEGYSGASAAAPTAAPQKPANLPGLLDPGRVALAGDSLHPENLATLRIDGKSLKDMAQQLGTINYDARQMKNTMNKIANDGVEVSAGQAATMVRDQGLNPNQVRLNDNGIGATVFQISRGRSAPGMG